MTERGQPVAVIEPWVDETGPRTEVAQAAARVDAAAPARAWRVQRALRLIAITDEIFDRAVELEG